MLSGSPFPDVSAPELAQQIQGKNKSKNKLPTWYNTPNIYYPPSLNLEQTSSEATAIYKSQLVTGSKLIDITGGLGVDAFYFNKNYTQVTYCERNTELVKIATHNFKALQAENIGVYLGDGLEFLKNSLTQYDVIYIDPSRRNEKKGKVFLLQDCEPNLLENLEFLLRKSSHLLIKTSPLLDITLGLQDLKYVTQLHVVAVKNEVKELVWILEKEPHKKPLTIYAVNITTKHQKPLIINYKEAISAQTVFSEPLTYLYEPNAALMKTGFFNWIGNHYQLKKLHQNSHLYTSPVKIKFPGRVFKVEEQFSYSKKSMKSFTKTKANITTRNFKESVQSIRKKFKISEGGDIYLFFTTNVDNKPIVLVCSKAE